MYGPALRIAVQLQWWESVFLGTHKKHMFHFEMLVTLVASSFWEVDTSDCLCWTDAKSIEAES